VSMRFAKLIALSGLLAVIAACTPKPPPRWQEGGAPLVIPHARWDRGKDSIEITPDGKVLDDGDLIMVVDRAGRLVDEDYEPIAILLPDGHVSGTDNRLLGRVGHANAALPGSSTAWLAILPNGQAIGFDEDGERRNAGVWHGCSGPALRTCTYVMHVILARQYLSRPRSGVGVGIGVMVVP
jgi:hypothetical protein